MNSRLFAAVALLAMGFCSGFLVSHWSTPVENIANDFAIRDGPTLQLENRSEQDHYLVVVGRKRGAADPSRSFLMGMGRTLSIERKGLEWLYVYGLPKVGFVIGEDGVPCVGAACTVPPLAPDPVAPSFSIDCSILEKAGIRGVLCRK